MTWVGSHRNNRAWVDALRYWNKMMQLCENRLTQNVFLNDLYLAQSGHINWCTNVYSIFEAINEEDIFYNRQIVNTVKSRFIDNSPANRICTT